LNQAISPTDRSPTLGSDERPAIAEKRNHRPREALEADKLTVSSPLKVHGVSKVACQARRRSASTTKNTTRIGLTEDEIDACVRPARSRTFAEQWQYEVRILELG